MIRKLTQVDHDLVFDYLKDEAAINLFMIGDLEVFGYENDIQDIWGDFDDANRLRGVLFRFFHSYIPYSQGEFDVDAFTKILLADPELEMVQGKSSIVQQFEAVPELQFSRMRELYFCEQTNADSLDANLDLTDVKVAALADVDRILACRAQIAEFGQAANARESLVKVMESGMGRTFYLEDADGRMISTASTTAENSLSAMVVGVCTLEDYRGRGIASKCMTALCKQLLSEGRTLCLFYDNPQAGSIYKRLGFQDIGMWKMNWAAK